MTDLSVNLNKIALLRNSRGRDYPNVATYAQRFIALGARGITIHPRPDERHITRQDAYDLADVLTTYSDVELNIEGYPSEDFIQMVLETKPQQCTLVPDASDQLTSDHGWDFRHYHHFIKDVTARLQAGGVRVAAFLDPDVEQVTLAADANVDRIELYTEAYAQGYQENTVVGLLAQYKEVTQAAQDLGIGVNAGHDLDLQNLAMFLTIPNILEVSIGHALTVECIDQGIVAVMEQYLAICDKK